MKPHRPAGFPPHVAPPDAPVFVYAPPADITFENAPLFIYDFMETVQQVAMLRRDERLQRRLVPRMPPEP